MRTLMALHAHPDDESSKGAGTVAKYADAGVRCVLVTATGGEAGDILNPAMDRPEVTENLAEFRRGELDEAARILGYHRVELLGHRDSGMPDTEPNNHPDAFVNVPFDTVLAQTVQLIREERPQVLLGYDEHIRYPHPDHVRVHDLGLAAFEAAADGSRWPELGEPWEVSKLYAPTFTWTRLMALHQAMLDRGEESPFAEWVERRKDSDDTGDHDASAHIDVSATLQRARDALRAHRTQVDPDGFWFQIPIEVVRDTYPLEDFTLMGSRVEADPPEDDLFARIPATALEPAPQD